MNEKQIISKIESLRNEGMSYQAIAEVLTSENIPTIGKSSEMA